MLVKMVSQLICYLKKNNELTVFARKYIGMVGFLYNSADIFNREEERMMKQKLRGKKGFIIVIVLVLLVAGYYYYLSNRQSEPVEEEVEISKVQDLLLRDLERNYPPSPKEVLKYYFDITTCLYNEKLSEEDIEALAFKIQEIYDDELAANKSQEDYLKDLKSEIIDFQESGSRIVNYSTSSSVDVEYFEEDTGSFARLYGNFYMQVQKSLKSLEEVFIMRKDEDGHWKIYGWQPIMDELTLGVEEE